MIRAEALRKTYLLGGQEIHALDGVNFAVDAGEMVAITGTSGSGKSTMMNILGCLDRPDSGSYYLCDEDVAQLGKDRLAEIRNRRIGFIFQNFNLLARLSSLENVEMPLLYAADPDARHKAEEALRLVGLADRMDHEPTQLSGGQRQRVAVARALAANPAIILADEPTGNLDTATSEEIMALLVDLHEQGRTILIVTHEPDIAAYCPRRIRMRDGQIVSDERGERRK